MEPVMPKYERRKRRRRRGIKVDDVLHDDSTHLIVSVCYMSIWAPLISSFCFFLNRNATQTLYYVSHTDVRPDLLLKARK